MGIEVDSTLGYAEKSGFRCGTCIDYHPYDFKNDKPMKIIERPLILMDTTFTNYNKISIHNLYLQTSNLIKRCKFVGGNFVILIHNDLESREPQVFNELFIKSLSTFC